MRRPPEHVKEDLSRQIFETKIPSEWILRDIAPDYGVDRSLEIVESGVVTGKEILIQLKGTESPEIHDDYISFSLSTDHLKYYLEKYLPVFLVVVDLKEGKCYWIFLQQYTFDVLNINNPSWVDQKTITIRMPLKQRVSDTLDRIISIAKGGSAYIISRKINQIPSKYLAEWKSNAEAIIKKSKVADDFLEKSLQLRFEVSYHYDKEGDHQKSIEALEEIYQSALGANNKNSAIKAGLLIAYQLNPYTQNEVVWGWLNEIKGLVEEVDSNSYNILWWGSMIEVVYIKLIKDYNSLLRLALISSQQLSNPMTPFLVSEIQEKINRLFKVEMDFVYYLNKAYEDKEYLIYLDFLKRLAKMHWLWCYNNSLKGNSEVIFHQLKSIENILLFAKDLSDVVSEDMKFSILLDLAYLYHFIEEFSLRDSIVEEAQGLAEKLEHRGYLQGIENAKESFERLLTIPYLLNFDDTKLPQREPTLEQEEELIKTLLKDAGIDIKGDDRLAEMARIGLKDRNPERILKHCEYLYTEIVTYGPIWDMVALPETGLKILHCSEKGNSIMGHSLDEVLEQFKKEYCKDCEHHSPRPDEWKWTRKWHRERKKPKRMLRAIESFFKH